MGPCPSAPGRASPSSRSRCSPAWPLLPRSRRRRGLPPSAAGWPGGTLEPADVARYLAFHKLRAVLDPLALASPPTANQQAYDVTAYDLDLTPVISSQLLRGSVRIRATVVSGPLFTMELDLADAMVVDSVKVAGVAAPFSRGTDLLTVTLGRAWLTGEGLDVTVGYHGTPALRPLRRGLRLHQPRRHSPSSGR